MIKIWSKFSKYGQNFQNKVKLMKVITVKNGQNMVRIWSNESRTHLKHPSSHHTSHPGFDIILLLTEVIYMSISVFMPVKQNKYHNKINNSN